MKIWYNVINNGDGSSSVVYFATQAEAEEDARREEKYSEQFNPDDTVLLLDTDNLDTLEPEDEDYRLMDAEEVASEVSDRIKLDIMARSNDPWR